MPVNIRNGKDIDLQEFLKDPRKKLAKESQKGLLVLNKSFNQGENSLYNVLLKRNQA